jgi:hypothetical protein
MFKPGYIVIAGKDIYQVGFEHHLFGANIWRFSLNDLKKDSIDNEKLPVILAFVDKDLRCSPPGWSLSEAEEFVGYELWKRNAIGKYILHTQGRYKRKALRALERLNAIKNNDEAMKGLSKEDADIRRKKEARILSKLRVILGKYVVISERPIDDVKRVN